MTIKLLFLRSISGAKDNLNFAYHPLTKRIQSEKFIGILPTRARLSIAEEVFTIVKLNCRSRGRLYFDGKLLQLQSVPYVRFQLSTIRNSFLTFSRIFPSRFSPVQFHWPLAAGSCVSKPISHFVSHGDASANKVVPVSSSFVFNSGFCDNCNARINRLRYRIQVTFYNRLSSKRRSLLSETLQILQELPCIYSLFDDRFAIEVPKIRIKVSDSSTEILLNPWGVGFHNFFSGFGIYKKYCKEKCLAFSDETVKFKKFQIRFR